MMSFDEPNVLRGLSDNSITDIIDHNGAVWMSTGAGLSFSYYDDYFWNQYDSTNGLNSDAVSAIYSAGETLWVAGNYFVENNDTTYADGLYFTDDDGITWNNIKPDNTFGGLRIVYDITGVDSLIFCTSWLGGLIGSFDGGQNWKNIYFTSSDSVYVNQPGYPNPSDPDLVPLHSNMYFSAAVDTTHQDSIVLWAGSVAGLRRYIYAPAYAKPSSNFILDYVAAEDYVYICGDRGLTRVEFTPTDADTVIKTFYSSYESDGLPGPTVTTAFSFGGRLFVGTADTIGGGGTGVVVSEDDGVSFSSGLSGLEDIIGPGKYAVEFATMGQYLFMAAFEGGLYMSPDTGQNWQKIYLDMGDTTLANGRNIINSVAADSFNLWVGTDSGVVLAYFNDLGGIDSTSYFVFEEAHNSGARSYQVAVQDIGDTLGNIDSTIIWTINHALDTLVGDDAVFFSNDYGATWLTDTNFLVHRYNDIDFINESICMVGLNAFTYSPDHYYWYTKHGSLVKDSANAVINFSGLDMTSIDIRNDTIYVGSENGFAISPPTASDIFIWHIFRANTNPTAPDKKTDFRYPNLSGDFVNVLDIQPLDNGESRIWASTQPAVEGGQIGVSTSTVDGLDWRILLTGNRVWNFAFNGPEVFAASSNGLLYSADTGWTWDTLTISGTKVTSDRVVDFSLDRNTFVTAVTIIGDSLWVGTIEEGAARIALADIGSDSWEIHRVYDSTFDVYAYPVPFSTNGNENVYFHYPVKQPGDVTIEVYDFNMDLVKTVIENQHREIGIYDNDRWNGRLDSGAPIAVGIYYFKIEMSTGETYWEKLAIIP